MYKLLTTTRCYFVPRRANIAFFAISSFGRPFRLKEVVKSEDPDRRSQYGSRKYNRLLITEESLRKQAGAKKSESTIQAHCHGCPMPVMKPVAGPADRVLCMLIIPAAPTGIPKTSPITRPVSKLIIITPDRAAASGAITAYAKSENCLQ